MIIQFLQKAIIVSLNIEEINISTKYFNFNNVFLFDFRAKLSKNTSINNYSINLVDDKLLPYCPIYSLRIVKLETLKSYIKINLVTRFI